MNKFIHILVAEDNEVSRNLLVGILNTQGYQVHAVADGSEAIDVIGTQQMDVALVDINMAPLGGLEFIKFLISKGISLPVIIITGDTSTDMLTETNGLGVEKVLTKPVEPERLIHTVNRILKRRGINPAPLAVETHERTYSHEALMSRAVNIALQNNASGKGGPFGALITDGDGKILGKGVNGRASRMDPTAHAEVMAIRQAAEKLGRGDLSDCILYCSSEPTMMGQALITSVGIKTVYYALTHDQIRHVRDRTEGAGKNQRVDTQYVQIGRDEAMDMFKALEKS